MSSRAHSLLNTRDGLAAFGLPLIVIVPGGFPLSHASTPLLQRKSCCPESKRSRLSIASRIQNVSCDDGNSLAAAVFAVAHDAYDTIALFRCRGWRLVATTMFIWLSAHGAGIAIGGIDQAIRHIRFLSTLRAASQTRLRKLYHTRRRAGIDGGFGRDETPTELDTAADIAKLADAQDTMKCPHALISVRTPCAVPRWPEQWQRALRASPRWD